jgi:hypothetical protein
MKEIGKDGMDRNILPENSLREGRNIEIFFNIGNELNEKTSINFFSKNEILSTFSTIE